MTNKLPQSKSVTISIVSHQQQEMIIPLLYQLEYFSGTLIKKILITINTPENKLITSEKFNTQIDIIKNARPQGFGENHNAAFTHCDTPWFLILNPDVRLEKDVISPLIAAAASRTGLIAPRVKEPGKIELEPHREIPTPAEILKRRGKNFIPPSCPAWVPGLFMLFKREAFSQIKGFDIRFFMYGEDFEICARLRLAGWELSTRDDLHVLHAAQRASHHSPKHMYWHATSLIKLWCSSSFWRYRRMLKESR